MKKSTAKKLCLMMLVIAVLAMTACGSKKKEENPASKPGNPTAEGGEMLDGLEDVTPPLDQISEDLPEDLPEEDWFDDMLQEEMTVMWSEEMAKIRDAVAMDLGDDYWPQAPMPAGYLEMRYGLTADMYDDYMGEMPLMSVRIDELLVVKAKDGQADAVEQALESYRQEVVANSGQYPMNVAKAQACMVKSIGNYVCFVMMGGDISEYEEQGDEAIIAHCIDQNNRVLDIISENIPK